MNNLQQNKTNNNLVDGKNTNKLKTFLEEILIQHPDLKTKESANVLSSMEFALQTTKTKDGLLALNVVSDISIKETLQQALFLGVDFRKSQAILITYGNSLRMQLQYFGTVAIAKKLANIKDVRTEIVYKGDIFELQYKNTILVATKHVTKVENIRGNNIQGVYCAAYNHDEQIVHAEYQSMQQINNAWQQSKNGLNVHNKFPEKMACKTLKNSVASYVFKTYVGNLENAEKYMSNLHFEDYNDGENEEENDETTEFETVDFETQDDNVVEPLRPCVNENAKEVHGDFNNPEFAFDNKSNDNFDDFANDINNEFADFNVGNDFNFSQSDNLSNQTSEYPLDGKEVYYREYVETYKSQGYKSKDYDAATKKVTLKRP